MGPPDRHPAPLWGLGQLLGHAESRPVSRVADVGISSRRQRFNQGDRAARVEGSTGLEDRCVDVGAVPQRAAARIGRERLEEGRGGLAVISGKEKHLGRRREILTKVDAWVVDPRYKAMARQKTSASRSGAIRSTSGKIETAGFTSAVRDESRGSMPAISCKARSSAARAPSGSVGARPSARNAQA